MLDTPQIVQSPAQLMAFIPLTVPSVVIMKVMGPGIKEVLAAVTAQGVGPVGPWFTYHLRVPTDTFDFKICVPVKAPVTPVGRVQAGELPAASVARTVYQGNYSGLGAGWGEFMKWIDARGLKAREDLWECYLVGPESGLPPTGWRTELNRPMKG